MIQTIISTYKLFIILRYVIKSKTNKGKSLTRQKHHCKSRESLLKPHRKHSKNLCTLPVSFSPLMHFTSVYFNVSIFLSQPAHPFLFSFTRQSPEMITHKLCVCKCACESLSWKLKQMCMKSSIIKTSLMSAPSSNESLLQFTISHGCLCLI